MAHYFSHQGYDGAFDQRGQGIYRLFVPDLSSFHRILPEAQLITYNASKEIAQLQGVYPPSWALKRDPGSLVIHIDGACRNNGQPGARASWGVFTSSRAEIEALSHGIDIIYDICFYDHSLTRVKIVSDSQYLVNTMSMWVYDWAASGGFTASGRPAVHFNRLMDLQSRLEGLESPDNADIDIQFWRVPRVRNHEADALAN
ncbi:Uu.00g076030.m01.CDS01 [Anthostomella pinea]|uniref:ribonuclease H n=1 Tax=Anthostomella pinea TaxID=933095 RepID=A0AAI8VVU4_9PEZI|nr:Uu.00g076030.m01.CDS01 [Anthostomella pinea]